MNNGYQQFFKKARENAHNNLAKPNSIARKNFKPSLTKKTKLPRKSKILLFPSFLVFIGLAIGFLYIDEVDQFLSKIEISFLGKALAENTGAKTAESKSEATASAKPEDAKKDGDTASEAGEAKSPETPAKGNEASKQSSDTELNHFARLSERKKELDAREIELKKMEEEIAKQREELEKKMTELDTMRRKISSVLEEKVQVDDKRVENLVQFYSTMKPQQAAKIIENIDEGLAVEVLARMKKKSAAEIMNLLKPEKAQVISEKYTGYRK
jgi:flagellar motility protein MotE (MotC chaperone)